MWLDEDAVLSNADYLYNLACNREERERAELIDKQFGQGPHLTLIHQDRYDRTIGPRSTKAAIRAIVMAINEASEEHINDDHHEDE